MEQKTQKLKNIFKTMLLSGSIALVFACSYENKSKQSNENNTLDLAEFNTDNSWYENHKIIAGRALGTTFVLKTSDDTLLISPNEINSFFDEFNNELSTYNPNSLISRFNNNNNIIDLNGTKYFKKCFELSYEIYNLTQGNFDPSVFPIIKMWDRLKEDKVIPTQQEIDSVLSFVGFENGRNYTYENGILTKTDSRFQLVFNAIAKGQSVDEIAEFLDKKGQENYFLEVGGEIRVKGYNESKMKWLIGIDMPLTSNTGFEDIDNRPIENYIEITNKSMATSGNYRDFYVLDSVIYGHTISSILGKPVHNNILSATVVADEVAVADGFATAFMAMGVDRTLNMLKNNPKLNIGVYLLFDNGEGVIKRAYNKVMLNYIMDK